MKKFKLALASVLLGVSGFASAGTTVLDTSGDLSGLADAKSYGFSITSAGTYDVSFSDLFKGKGLDLIGYVIEENVKGKWVTVDTGSAGSGDFLASAGKYIAVVGDLSLPASKVAFSIDVSKAPSPVPEPETWAIMLLGVGFIVYQVRPSKNRGSMAIRPA